MNTTDEYGLPPLKDVVFKSVLEHKLVVIDMPYTAYPIAVHHVPSGQWYIRNNPVDWHSRDDPNMRMRLERINHNLETLHQHFKDDPNAFYVDRITLARMVGQGVTVGILG